MTRPTHDMLGNIWPFLLRMYRCLTVFVIVIPKGSKMSEECGGTDHLSNMAREATLLSVLRARPTEVYLFGTAAAIKKEALA